MPFVSCRLRWFRLASLFFLGLLPAMTHAQSSTGTLLGEVQDSKGARVASASVVINTPDQSLRRQATTNNRGEFRFENVPPGSYHVSLKPLDFAVCAEDL